jgi:hypothetical protein
VSFEDFSERDAGFYEKVNGNPNTWFEPADFHRHLLYGATFAKLAGRRSRTTCAYDAQRDGVTNPRRSTATRTRRSAPTTTGVFPGTGARLLPARAGPLAVTG